jgi:very-short-patch-repair endonuclease
VEGLVVHRTRGIDRLSHKGLATTSAARTILDLASRLDDVPLRRLMSRAQSMHLTNLRLLGRQLDRAAGRPGRARFARVLASRPPATRTELEDRVHDLLTTAGLTPPHVNVPLHLEGRRLIPDFRWPEQHLIVEADSTQWHDTPQARADDAERQALLEAHGERVIRVTWQQATAHAAQTVRRVAATLARPGAEEPPGGSSSRAQRTTGTT